MDSTSTATAVKTTSVEKTTIRARATSTVWRDRVIQLTSLVVVLVVWEIYGRSVNPILFTYPTAVAQAAVGSITSGELWKYLSASLVTLAIGLGLSIVVGIPLGLLMARFHIVDTVLETYINALNATPTVAYAPLITLWFGFDTTAKVVIVFLFTIFSIILNTYQGVKNVERNLLEVARSFCASERQLWGDVMLPSALPYILVGLRLAIGRGLVGMVIADILTAISGISYLLILYANSFQTAKLFVPILTLMMLGTTLTWLLKVLEVRLTPWLSHNQTG